MEIIKVDQLSVAARAGALDGSLAYASVYEQHRDLISQTALGGLRGLEQILSETGVYGNAIRTLKEAASKIPEANELALRDPFQPASGSLQGQHSEATLNGLRAQGQGYMSTAQGIENYANYVVGVTTTEPEKSYASSAQWAANELTRLGTGYLVNQGDPNASRHHATVALNSALDTRNKAQALMNQLAGQNPFPAARYNSVSQVWNAANQVVNHANTVLDFVNNNPIAQIRSHTPMTHDLGGGYSLSTWGNSGYWTLTDAGGSGILVRPNGMVDNIRGGAGWKVDTTSTFILPNETKITINPGSPANLLISRGIHAFTISNLNGGTWPNTGSYTDLNGREIDRSTNDGYVLEMSGNAGSWRNGSNQLGDGGSREVIATTPLTHEEKKDPTDVSISSEMRSFIAEAGLVNYDYDNDGMLNNVELMEVANQMATYIRSIQDAYEQALTRLAQANQALTDLNSLIEQLQDENERSTESRQNDAANARSDLQALERKLVATLQMLQGTAPTDPLQGDIETSATQVLAQLHNISQNGGITQTPSVPPVSGNPTSGTTTVQTTGQPSPRSNGGGADAIGDGLRRAGRLLSGILGGGNLNILELPEKPAGSSPNTVTTTTTPPVTGPFTGSTPPTTGVVLGTEGGQTQPSESIPGTGTGTNKTPDNGTVQPTATVQQTASPLGSLLSLLSALKPPQEGPLPIQGGPQILAMSQQMPVSSDGLLPQLSTLTTPTDGTPPLQLTPQNLAAGLETLLVALAQLGVFQPSPSTPTEVGGSMTTTSTLLQTLDSLVGPPQTPSASTTPPTTTPRPQPITTPLPSITLDTAGPQAPALLGFLQLLGQLGESLPETRPQQQPSPTLTTQPEISPTPTQIPTSTPPPTSTSTPTPPPLPPSVQQLLTLLTGESAASLPKLSLTSEQVASLLAGTAQLGSTGVQQGSGSTTHETGGLAKLSRMEAQLLLVLQGMAALGSAGAGQSTSTNGTQAPKTTDLRLGLQAFLTALSAFGILGTGSSQQQTSTNDGGVVLQGGSNNNTQAISTITGNFQTDPELLKIIEENLSKALRTQQRQLSQASTLFTQSQEIVQKFVTLIKENDLVRDVVKGDDLSDEQQTNFDQRMQDLRKDWGVEWGSSDSHTPANQSQLVSKAMQSGMMV